MLGELLQEPYVDVLVDKDPGPVRADLSLAEEVGHEGPLDGVPQVGVGKHDERRLAAQLEGDGADANGAYGERDFPT